MKREEIIEKLREILASVSMLYMVIAIEEEFGIRFDDVGASDFVLLSDVVDYIEEKLK